MIEVNLKVNEVHTAALDGALKAALGSRIVGVSTYAPDRPLSIWMADEATPGDIEVARAVAAIHDPVFLSLDRTTIRAGGVDEATITVLAPKAGAAPVILVAEGFEIPVTLENGVGLVGVSSMDAGIVVWTLKDAANRTTDQARIEVQRG